MKTFIRLLLITFCFTTYGKTITVLSIDGGGIRGIIPAIVIQEIDKRLQFVSPSRKHISQYIDIMAGNSTGGIITLLLNVTNKSGVPIYNPNHVVEFYKELGHKVFQRSWWHKITTLSGWTGDKYDPKALEELLDTYLRNKTLLNTSSNVIIPAFDAEQQQMHFFRTTQASKYKNKNYYLKDVARATSAAPTYFPPAVITNTAKSITSIMIDGGISSNNPTMCACVHAIELYGKDINLVVISIGTGRIKPSENNHLGNRSNINNMGVIDWAPFIVSMMMDSDTDMVDYQIKTLLNHRYFRLQIDMDKDDAAMDDASPDNIEQLEQYAHQLIDKHNEDINKIVDILVNV